MGPDPHAFYAFDADDAGQLLTFSCALLLAYQHMLRAASLLDKHGLPLRCKKTLSCWALARAAWSWTFSVTSCIRYRGARYQGGNSELPLCWVHLKGCSRLAQDLHLFAAGRLCGA